MTDDQDKDLKFAQAAFSDMLALPHAEASAIVDGRLLRRIERLETVLAQVINRLSEAERGFVSDYLWTDFRDLELLAAAEK